MIYAAVDTQLLIVHAKITTCNSTVNISATASSFLLRLFVFTLVLLMFWLLGFSEKKEEELQCLAWSSFLNELFMVQCTKLFAFCLQLRKLMADIYPAFNCIILLSVYWLWLEISTSQDAHAMETRQTDKYADKQSDTSTSLMNL